MINLSLKSIFRVNIDHISVYVSRKEFVVGSLQNDCVEMDLRNFQLFQQGQFQEESLKNLFMICQNLISKKQTHLFLTRFDAYNCIEQLIFFEFLVTLLEIHPHIKVCLFTREVDSLLFDFQIIETYRRLIRYKIVLKLPEDAGGQGAGESRDPVLRRDKKIITKELFIYNRKDIYEKIVEGIRELDYRVESISVFAMK